MALRRQGSSRNKESFAFDEDIQSSSFVLLMKNCQIKVEVMQVLWGYLLFHPHVYFYPPPFFNIYMNFGRESELAMRYRVSAQ